MNRDRTLRVLLDLARAQLRARSARIRFRDTERSTATRTVDVLALAFDPPRWVVATWARESGSLRLLDVARVLRVTPTRRRSAPPPDGFDPLHFAVRGFLDAGAGPQAPASVRLEPPWTEVARALLPTCAVERLRGGAGRCRVVASRPEIVGALAASLAPAGGIHCGSSPCPGPARSRSPTRRASSGSPRGSSRSPSR